MTNNEQTPAVMVITPDDIGFATAEENKASQVLAQTMFDLVNSVHKTHPKLYRHEAIYLADVLLREAFAAAQQDPGCIAELHCFAEKIIQARN